MEIARARERHLQALQGREASGNVWDSTGETEERGELFY